MQVIFDYTQQSDNGLPYDVTHIWSMSPTDIRALTYRRLYQNSRNKLLGILSDIASWLRDQQTNNEIRIKINYGRGPKEFCLHYKSISDEHVIVDKADFKTVFSAILYGFKCVRETHNYKKGVI